METKRIIFTYNIQLEAKGMTELGREVSFLLNQSEQATVTSENYDYTSGKVISSDVNKDFVPESIGVMTQKLVSEYALRHSLVLSTIQIVSYTVSTKEEDVVVYFQPKDPTKRVSDPNALVYAYYAVDTIAPLPPHDVESFIISEGIALSWLQEGHHHGIRIYNDKGLLANLGQGALEWIDTDVEANHVYVYYLASYTDLHESPLVKVSVRYFDEEVPTATDPETGKTIHSPYQNPSRETHTLPSFQSGTGDHTDLHVVMGTQHTPKERFTYSMQLKGFEERVINVYPERSFQYRILAYAGSLYLAETPWRIGSVDGVLPFKTEGAGKENLRIPIDLEITSTATVTYQIELNDPYNYVTYQFETSQKQTTIDKNDFVIFSSRVTSRTQQTLRDPYYGAFVKGKGTYIVEQNQPIVLDEELPNPMVDPVLSTKNITEWVIVLSTSNPNVKLEVAEAPASYRVESLRFLRVKIQAAVVNPTQTPWNPYIHNGYYYLNQSEHYLYSETNVQGNIEGDMGFVPLKFVYGIDILVRNKGVLLDYSTSITAEVASDQRLHKISDRKIKETMNEVLLKNNLKLEETEVVRYTFKLADDYPVTLTARDYPDSTNLYDNDKEMGEGYVYAQTTGTIFEFIYNELKVKVNERNETFVKPIPRQSAPIIIQDATGIELTQTFFYDENGKQTLFFSEQLTTNLKNECLLSYLEIDKDSLILEYQTGETWIRIVDYILLENYLKLYPSIPPGTTIRARYALKSSFYVDYNYNEKEDFAKVVLHNPALDDSRELKVVFETSDNAYYRAEEIDLNPLKNVQHAGFLYVANDFEPAQTITLYAQPHTLFANGHDTTFIRAIVKDKYGNPVAGDSVHFTASVGTLEMLQSVTDINGLATAKYVAPSTKGEALITVIDTTQQIEAQEKIYLREEVLRGRMTLQTSYPTIYPFTNEITVTAHIYGENQEPIAGVPVVFNYTHGNASTDTASTDQFGAASMIFTVDDIPRTGVIRIRASAPSLNLSVDTVVRIEGFRDYHPDFFVQSNNLIDIYDRISAKDSLGITVSGAEPTNAELNDLWLDHGDVLYLTQSYELRDVKDRSEARKHLGVHVNSTQPVEPWPNDLWVENDTEKGES